MKRIGVVGWGKLAFTLTAVLAGGAFIAAQAPRRVRPPGRGDPRRNPRSRAPALKVGQTAPDFELPTLAHAISITKLPASRPALRATSRPTSQPATQPAAGKVRLSSFRGKKPVFLIFASYT